MYPTVYVLTITNAETRNVIYTDKLTEKAIAAVSWAQHRAEAANQPTRIILSVTDNEYTADVTELFIGAYDALEAITQGEVLEHATRVSIAEIISEAQQDAEHYGNTVIIDSQTSNDGEEIIYISAPNAESVVIIVDVYNDYYRVASTTNGEYVDPEHAKYFADTPGIIDDLRELVHDTTAQVHHRGCPSNWYETDDDYM